MTISVTGNDAISFSDTVNLILCDSAHLTVTSTGSRKSAIAGGKRLHIFAQSMGDNKGKLEAQGDYGVSCGFLNVYGGEVALY